MSDDTQPMEPMYQACPNVVNQFSGNPANCFGASASIDFYANRSKPGYKYSNVVPLPSSVDSLMTRSLFDIESPAAVSLENSYDAASGNVSGTIHVKFDSSVPSGDYRVGLYVIEDSIHGPGNDAPGNFYQSSDWVSGTYDMDYYFPDVLRAEVMNDDFWGKAGLLPSTPEIGTDYAVPFAYSLPALYYDIAPKPEHMKLIAFVTSYTDFANGSVVNSASVKYTETTTPIRCEARLPDAMNMRVCFTKGNAVLNFSAPATVGSELRLFTASGENILRSDVKPGTKSFQLGHLSSGCYFAKLINGTRTISAGLIIP